MSLLLVSYHWMLSSTMLVIAAILADEMGLGKTIQVLQLLESHD